MVSYDSWRQTHLPCVERDRVRPSYGCFVLIIFFKWVCVCVMCFHSLTVLVKAVWGGLVAMRKVLFLSCHWCW